MSADCYPSKFDLIANQTILLHNSLSELGLVKNRWRPLSILHLTANQVVSQFMSEQVMAVLKFACGYGNEPDKRKGVLS